MGTSKVTAKGQVTIPKDVRDRLGLRIGDDLEFVEEGGAFRIRKHVDPDALQEYRGYLKELASRRSDDLVRELRGP